MKGAITMDRCDCKCDCSGCTMTRKAYKRKRRDSLLRTLDRAEKKL